MTENAEIKEKLRALSDSTEGRIKARDMAIKAIQKAPSDAELRLLLAKLYYMDGLFEFATRELIEIQFMLPTPSVERLLQQFTEYSAPLLARYKDVPSVNGEKPKPTPLVNKDAEAKPAAKKEDEVVADFDVDLDLFDE